MEKIMKGKIQPTVLLKENEEQSSMNTCVQLATDCCAGLSACWETNACLLGNCSLLSLNTHPVLKAILSNYWNVNVLTVKGQSVYRSAL